MALLRIAVGFDPSRLQLADEGIDVLHLKANVIHGTAFGRDAVQNDKARY